MFYFKATRVSFKRATERAVLFQPLTTQFCACNIFYTASTESLVWCPNVWWRWCPDIWWRWCPDIWWRWCPDAWWRCRWLGTGLLKAGVWERRHEPTANELWWATAFPGNPTTQQKPVDTTDLKSDMMVFLHIVMGNWELEASPQTVVVWPAAHIVLLSPQKRTFCTEKSTVSQCSSLQSFGQLLTTVIARTKAGHPSISCVVCKPC